MYLVKFNAVKNLNGNDLVFDLITLCPWSSLIMMLFLKIKIKILIKTQKSNLSVNIVFKICNRVYFLK